MPENIDTMLVLTRHFSFLKNFTDDIKIAGTESNQTYCLAILITWNFRQLLLLPDKRCEQLLWQ